MDPLKTERLCERGKGLCTCKKKAEDATPGPRPADLAELAAQVSKELRKRGIWASHDEQLKTVAVPARTPEHATLAMHCMHFPAFDNLGPIACADMIQALEATRAQEWAGDK